MEAIRKENIIEPSERTKKERRYLEKKNECFDGRGGGAPGVEVVRSRKAHKIKEQKKRGGRGKSARIALIKGGKQREELRGEKARAIEGEIKKTLQKEGNCKTEKCFATKKRKTGEEFFKRIPCFLFFPEGKT